MYRILIIMVLVIQSCNNDHSQEPNKSPQINSQEESENITSLEVSDGQEGIDQEDSSSFKEYSEFKLPSGLIDFNTGELVSFDYNKYLIMYFSPTCPHSINAYPKFVELSESMKEDGFKGVLISTGLVQVPYLIGFVRDYNVELDVLFDAENEFSEKYGDGHVPRFYCFNENDNGVRLSITDESDWPKINEICNNLD